MTNVIHESLRGQRRGGRFSARRRGGYAMVTVLVFVVTLFSWYAVTYQRAAGALRQQQVQALQQLRDRGAVQALARTCAVLETGLPPTSPFVAGVDVDTPAGLRRYTVTIRHDREHRYNVSVERTPENENPQPLPSILAATKHPK